MGFEVPAGLGLSVYWFPLRAVVKMIIFNVDSLLGFYYNKTCKIVSGRDE